MRLPRGLPPKEATDPFEGKVYLAVQRDAASIAQFLDLKPDLSYDEQPRACLQCIKQGREKTGLNERNRKKTNGKTREVNTKTYEENTKQKNTKRS